MREKWKKGKIENRHINKHENKYQHGHVNKYEYTINKRKQNN